MIKHRFILRSWKEAEVFAAVPTEHEVLTWRRWERPVAVDKLIAGIEAQLARIDKMKGLASDRAEMRKWASQQAEAELQKLESDIVKQDADHDEKIRDLERRYRRDVHDPAVGDRIASLRRDQEVTRKEWHEKVDQARRKIGLELDEMLDKLLPLWELMLVSINEHQDELRRVAADATWHAVDGRTDAADYHRHLSEIAASSLVCATQLKEITGDLSQKFAPTFETLSPEWISALEVDVSRPDPTDVLTCPEGVPFPCYTVEIPFPPKLHPLDTDAERVVVEVVEGCAWFEVGRVRVEGTEDVKEAIAWRTDTVRMAAELVTQMLTERKRNPRAETRLQVDEVNSAKAQATRLEDARPSAEPRVRSIKFDVAPPRYLREAAERIIASKVKAHWVMGHWRNQPYGQGRSLRRETWIAPHVRGLGEAGATMSKVAAPRSVSQ